jgi:hypothetical protein
MQKDDGPIVKVNLNDWATKRRDGFVFRTEAEFNAQGEGAAPDRDDDDDPTFPTMDNTKAEILEYCDANGIQADAGLTKSDLLELIGA